MSASLRAVVLTLLVSAPLATAADPEGTWIDSDYVLEFAALDELRATAEMDVHRATIDGKTYDADGLREAWREARAAGRAGEFLREVSDDVAADFEGALSAAFPGSTVAEAEVVVDRQTLDGGATGAPTDPPVRVSLATDVDVDLSGLGWPAAGDDVGALLAAGVRLELPLTFVARPGHDAAFDVRLPAEVAAVETDGGVRTARGFAVEVENARGHAVLGRDVRVLLGDPRADAPTEHAGAIEVTLDLERIDVSLPGAASGDFGTVTMHVVARAALDAFHLPPEAAAAFPDGVRVEGLEADALRDLLERDLVDRDLLDSAAEAVGDDLESRLEDALGAEVSDVAAAWDAESLAGEGPVVLEATATVVRALAAPGAPDRGAALALYTLPLELPLHRVESLDTTYRVVLPEGLALAGAESDGADVEVLHRDDGRDEVVARMAADGPSRATLAVQVAVTPTFVVAEFWPILVGALALVGLVGAGAWIGVRRLLR